MKETENRQQRTDNLQPSTITNFQPLVLRFKILVKFA